MRELEIGDIILFDNAPKDLYVITEKAPNSATSWLSVSIENNNREWVFRSRYYLLCEGSPNTINHRWRFLNDPLPKALSP